jgi:hypothetical protein
MLSAFLAWMISTFGLEVARHLYGAGALTDKGATAQPHLSNFIQIAIQHRGWLQKYLDGYEAKKQLEELSEAVGQWPGAMTFRKLIRPRLRRSSSA